MGLSMRLRKVFALALALLSVSYGVSASELKIGLVDRQVLMQDSLYAKSVSEKMKKEFGGRQDALIAKDKELRSKFEALERDKEILSESERVAKEREITTMQQKLQEEGGSLQEDFQHRQEKEGAAFNKVVSDILAEIAKEEKLDLILDQQVAAYNNRKGDFTYKALQMMDKRYKEDKKQ